MFKKICTAPCGNADCTHQISQNTNAKSNAKEILDIGDYSRSCDEYQDMFPESIPMGADDD